MTEYEDRQDISDLLVRYATGIDSHDWTLFRTVFTDDCQLDYGEFGSWNNVYAVTEFMKAAHAGVQTLHRMSNQAITVDGDKAEARTYVDMIMVAENMPAVNAIGYYDDEIVRVGDGWHIARRRFTSVRMSTQ